MVKHTHKTARTSSDRNTSNRNTSNRNISNRNISNRNISNRNNTDANKTSNGSFNSYNMLKKRLILLLLFVIVIGVGITAIFYYAYYLVDIQSINASVIITESSTSFDAGNTSLNFARMTPGVSAIKYINITSKKDIKVRIVTDGNISPFLTFSQEQFYMQKGEETEIIVTLNIPQDVALGYYSGKVLVYFYRS